MSDPSTPGGPPRRPDPDQTRIAKIDLGRSEAGPPNTPWSVPQESDGMPTPPAVGWGSPPPHSGWTQPARRQLEPSAAAAGNR